jgi:hypothetical protein
VTGKTRVVTGLAQSYLIDFIIEILQCRNTVVCKWFLGVFVPLLDTHEIYRLTLQSLITSDIRKALGCIVSV